MAKLEEVGRRLRDLFAEGSPYAERIRTRCDDRYIGEFARAVAGQLGERVGVAPRIYLRKLVLEILDRIDQFEDFDPRTHYRLTIARTELTPEERQAAGAGSVDEIELDLPDAGEAAR
jgi:hypothetical protein